MSHTVNIPQPLELWGGVECTVNRVGQRYFDAMERDGHARRIEDLDLFAEIGLKALRYPVLWERTAPNGLAQADWSWPDARLSRIRELGMEPVVGLLHHGSGPAGTHLLDPAFPEQFAAYARAVAERYPWVTRFLPVNEPLTTARFSGLYGHWYPHEYDGLAWAKILLNQCRATVLAVQAIREVSPHAVFVQNEDIGTTFSTPRLAYQAEFENERRWLTFDLLCGRVGAEHPMTHYLRWLGVSAGELQFFQDNPCVPDLLGIDYYVTSERFLDHRVKRYPLPMVGGNGRERYADVEAVRVRAEGLAGLAPLLREAWSRYNLPIAVTEAHLGASDLERVRWFGEMWAAAGQVRAEGVDVRAVTAWALLGCCDWDSLVTRMDGHYEAGVFEMRGDMPCPTPLAEMLRALARQGRFNSPILDTPGWCGARSVSCTRPPLPAFLPDLAPMLPPRFCCQESLMEAVLDSLFSSANATLKLAPPSPRLTLSVVVPVRNEAAGITRTLASLARQVDLAGQPLDPSRYEVLLLANNCTDDTAEAARCFARRIPEFNLHVAEISLPPETAHVGTARRLLMDAACRRVTRMGQCGVIASTDGDTKVAPDWAAQTLWEIEGGVDAVGGRIRVERRRGEDREARLYALRDMAYQRGLARLEHLLDPDPADPWPRHHQFFGGSLAVTAKAYCAAGGLPPLPCLEDVALGNALRRLDARIRHSPAVCVSTSPRQQGRTPLGLSAQLREWGQRGRAGEAHWVQQPEAVAVRFAARRALRRSRQSRLSCSETAALAETLAVPISVLSDGLADKTQPFGVLWVQVMEYHMQPDGAWARRWPLIEMTAALPALRRRLQAMR